MKGLLFTYALTYGGAVASLVKPWYGLLIYVCFSIIKPDQLWYWSVPPGNYSRIVAIGLLVGWAMRGFGNWDFGRARPVVIAGIGYWVWSAVSAAVAPDQKVAWPYVEALSKIMLPFLVGVTLTDSPEKIRQMLWVVALSVGYIAVEMNLAYRGGLNVEQDGFLGLDNNSVALLLVPGTGLGLFLAMTERRWFLKGLAVLIALAVAHVCMFSFSRGAMLAMAFTGGVSFVLIPKRPVHYVALAIVVLVCLRLMGKQVTDEFLSSFNDAEQRDASAEGRIELWGHCWDTMLQHPVTGVGPEHWQYRVVQYGFRQGKEAHSTWFQIGAELGFPGIVSLLAMYALVIAGLWRICRAGDASHQWAIEASRCVIASLAGVLIAISFVTCERVEVPYYLAMTGAGVLALESRCPIISRRLAHLRLTTQLSWRSQHSPAAPI